MLLKAVLLLSLLAAFPVSPGQAGQGGFWEYLSQLTGDKDSLEQGHGKLGKDITNLKESIQDGVSYMGDFLGKLSPQPRLPPDSGSLRKVIRRELESLRLKLSPYVDEAHQQAGHRDPPQRARAAPLRGPARPRRARAAQPAHPGAVGQADPQRAGPAPADPEEPGAAEGEAEPVPREPRGAPGNPRPIPGGAGAGGAAAGGGVPAGHLRPDPGLHAGAGPGDGGDAAEAQRPPGPAGGDVGRAAAARGGPAGPAGRAVEGPGAQPGRGGGRGAVRGGGRGAGPGDEPQ